MKSALYPGSVSHVRIKPRRHSLSLRIWSMLIDLDELDALDRRLRIFSVGRFNLVSFDPRDRGDGSDAPLKSQVEATMRTAGLTPDGGAIWLLTMPKFLGYAFNPLSIYFCHDRAGGLIAILYEVDNTFGERHAYLLKADAREGRFVRQACAKNFYVSPFMDMDLAYDFRVLPPEENFALRIDVSDTEGLVMTARHHAKRVEISDAALFGVLVKLPFAALRVVLGIHIEALKIWRKGVRLRERPKPPKTAASFATSPQRAHS